MSITWLVCDICFIYFGVFVIFIWAFLLSSNLGTGYRYKFWPVSAPEHLNKLLQPLPNDYLYSRSKNSAVFSSFGGEDV